MRTKNLNLKTELLLGAGLDVLHQESREWQETVAFWKDETRFFKELLQKKESKLSEYGKILQNLDEIHKNLFDYLVDDIVNHERQLSCLYKGEKGLADGDYREKHGSLNKQMYIFSNDFREFKKMVFAYVKIL